MNRKTAESNIYFYNGVSIEKKVVASQLNNSTNAALVRPLIDLSITDNKSLINKKSEKLTQEEAAKLKAIEDKYIKTVSLAKDEIELRFEEKQRVENDDGEYLSKVDHLLKLLMNMLQHHLKSYKLSQRFSYLSYYSVKPSLMTE